MVLKYGPAWMGGWMDGWVDGRAGLRIAHSNQKWFTWSLIVTLANIKTEYKKIKNKK